jgi:hypothetical protein
VIFTLDVNGINIILEEMAIILLWQFLIFSIFAEVDFYGVFSKFVHKTLLSFSLFIGDFGNILVGSDRGIIT